MMVFGEPFYQAGVFFSLNKPVNSNFSLNFSDERTGLHVGLYAMLQTHNINF